MYIQKFLFFLVFIGFYSIYSIDLKERLKYIKRNIDTISIWSELKKSINLDDLATFNYLIERRDKVTKETYINSQDSFGMSLLMIAATQGKEKIASRLLNLGAKKNLTNEYPRGQRTAYELALANNHKAIAPMLKFEAEK